MPTCWIIAGPNGAGKTTFALDYLPTKQECDRFLNTDLLAYAMNPLNPDSQIMAAGRLFLSELDKTINKGKSFAFETTLSGKSYLRVLRRMKEAGWYLHLVYLAISAADVSAQRVAERVLKGGHDVPQEDLERRFPRSLRNLFGEYSKVVDFTQCYWNEDCSQELLFQIKDGDLTILDEFRYTYLQKLCQK